MFLEKATLPKPVPLPRTHGPQKVKDIIKASAPDLDLPFSTSKRKRPAKSKSNTIESTTDQPSLDSTAYAGDTTAGEQCTTQADAGNGTEAKHSATTKRKSPANETKTTKRRKTSHPQGIDQPEPPVIADRSIIERETVLLSLIKENDGVLELNPRLDLMYTTHVNKFFPQAQHHVDVRLINISLDALEERAQIMRIILHAETSTGTKQYKFIFALPEIDPVTNPRIHELRDQLHREAGSYQPAVINETPREGVTRLEPKPATIETVQNASKVPVVPIVQPEISTQTVQNTPKPPILAPIPRPTAAVITPPPRVETPKKRGRPSNQSRALAATSSLAGPTDGDLDSESSDNGFSLGSDISNWLEAGATSRRRMIFKPEEDQTIYQGTALLNKYVAGHSTPWTLLKNILPDRKVVSIKRRSSLLEAKMKTEITSFLDSFEGRYEEALKQGTVKEIKSGPEFNLKYYLDWYNSNELEDVEERPTVSRFVRPFFEADK